MPTSDATPKTALEVIKLTKRFGDFAALDDVSFKVRQGSFHALLGENGAGKSTLVKCVMGYERPTDGDVLINERGVHFESTREAHAAGIGMVYQHFTLVPNMTVAENLVLVRADVPLVIDWTKERVNLQAFMHRMPFGLPLDVPVRALSAGDKQKLEILKQLYLERKLLFLDEPTSVLTPAEADEVLGLLHELTRTSGLTVLMITHKFREVQQFADRVTVLRRGRLVGEGNADELSMDDMARLMVGQELLREVPRARNVAGESVLRVEALTALDDTGLHALDGITFDVHRGEILGVAGVSGNGQSQLVEVLAGQRRAKTGTITVKGQPFRPTRESILSARVTVLPEVPLDNACVADMSVSENMALRDFDRAPILRFRWLVSKRRMREQAAALVARFKVKTPSLDAPIRQLSGGNVQRAVLARELSRPIDVLVIANPCFGLDFSATAEIRSKIMQARNGGSAVLLIGEDLDELLELSDRLIVLYEGRVVHETATAAAQRVEVGHFMAGH